MGQEDPEGKVLPLQQPVAGDGGEASAGRAFPGRRRRRVLQLEQGRPGQTRPVLHGRYRKHSEPVTRMGIKPHLFTSTYVLLSRWDSLIRRSHQPGLPEQRPGRGRIPEQVF